MEKKLIKFFLIFCIFTLPKINTAQVVSSGLLGFDATFYYRDAYNVEWIGTGSSGGIYYKDANSWRSCNDPFGPGHIYWIGEINNELVVNCDLNFYTLDRKKSKWFKLQNSRIIGSINKKINVIDSVQVSKLVQRVKNNKILTPKGTNSLFAINEDSIVFCTENGLIYLNLKNNLYTKSNIKIEAADVVKVQCNDEEVFCLTHEDKIWKLESNGWKQLTDYSNKYENELDFYELNLDTLRKNYSIKPPFNIFSKNRAFCTTNDKVFQIANNNIFVFDLATEISTKLDFNLPNNIFDIQINKDSIVFVYNLEIINDIYYADFITTKLNVDHLIVVNKYRSNVVYNFNYGIYPFFKYKKSSFSLTPLNNGYFLHENDINKKVISYCFFKNKIFLGTYGSGVIEIDDF